MSTSPANGEGFAPLAERLADLSNAQVAPNHPAHEVLQRLVEERAFEVHLTSGQLDALADRLIEALGDPGAN